jgi:acyl-CoA synthetase (AMP-forming)/AMP-acid ligase II/acyl carrier protein
MSGVREAVEATLSTDPDRTLLFVPGGSRYTRGEIAALSQDWRERAEVARLADGDVVLLEFSREQWPLFVAAYCGCLRSGLVPAIVSAEGGSDRRDAVLAALPVRLAVRGKASQPSGWDDCEFAELPPRGSVPAPVAEYLTTSGTTGTPKLVAITERVRRRDRERAEGVRAPGVLVLAAPPGTNAAQTALVEALYSNGGGLACLDRWSPAAFTDLVEASGAGAALLAPALAASLVDAPDFTPQRLRSLRVIRLSMAPADPRLIETIADRLPGTRVLNVYTTTEAWPAGTVMSYRSDDVHTVGQPLPGTRMSVVDERGQEVPPGTRGRVLLAHVARADAAGEPVWVDTGDLGLLADGGLVLCGRENELVARGGAVVSFVEVEQAAIATGLVTDAAAWARSGPADALALAVVWRGEPDETALLAVLRERLGPESVPSVVTAVAELPRDPQGKLRRAELAELAPPAPAAPADGTLAEVLAEIWTEVLMRDSVADHDDFFALGGDSLAAVMCNTLVEERLDLVVPLAAHYEAPTFRALLDLLEDRRTT